MTITNTNTVSNLVNEVSPDVAVHIRAAELFIAGMVNYMLHANDIHELE